MSGREDPRIPYRKHTGVDLTSGNCVGLYEQGLDLFSTRDARHWVVDLKGCDDCPVKVECEAEIEHHVEEDRTISRSDPILGTWGGRFFRYQNGRPVEVRLAAPTRKSSLNWSRKVLK